MALDLLVGEDLRQVLKRVGRLSVADAVDVVLDVCRALRGAHSRGVVHRDIKPSNIFLELAEGCGPGAKLLDFGIAKHSAQEGTTDEFTLLGTVAYMSPEQIVSSKRVDHRADIYSLGLVLYEALNGRPAYEGDRAQVLYDIVHGQGLSLADFDHDIPRPVAQAIVTATAREAEVRHVDVETFAACLAPFAGNGLFRRTQHYIGSGTSIRHHSLDVNSALVTTRSGPLSEIHSWKTDEHSRWPRLRRGRQLTTFGMVLGVASLIGIGGWASNVTPSPRDPVAAATPLAQRTAECQQWAPATTYIGSSSKADSCDWSATSTEDVSDHFGTKPETAAISSGIAPLQRHRILRDARTTIISESVLIQPGVIFVPDNPYNAR